MPTPRKGARLGGSPSHQRQIVANLATALFEHGRITTTETKARVLRPVAEKLITKAKRAPLGTVQSLHNRREVLKTIHDKSVVHTLFTDIADTFKDRPGGYTRITKIGPRKGDNAPMAVIELVTESYTPSAPKKKPTKKAAEKPAAVEVEKPAEGAPAEVAEPTDAAAPAEVEATDASGETEVLETEATDVETAEAQSEATEEPAAEPEAAEAPEAAAEEPEDDAKA